MVIKTTVLIICGKFPSLALFVCCFNANSVSIVAVGLTVLNSKLRTVAKYSTIHKSNKCHFV